MAAKGYPNRLSYENKVPTRACDYNKISKDLPKLKHENTNYRQNHHEDDD